MKHRLVSKNSFAWQAKSVSNPRQNLPGDADALTTSDEVEGVIRFVEFPDLAADETVVEELTRITLDETEEVWALLSDVVISLEEKCCVVTGVNVGDVDGEGEIDTVIVKEILVANKADDETAVEADADISKETEKKNWTF